MFGGYETILHNDMEIYGDFKEYLGENFVQINYENIFSFEGNFKNSK